MVAFHIAGYIKKQYEKRYSEKRHGGKRRHDDV
jgi:hypothetical protein